MRIRELDPLPPLDGPATVIVNAEGFAVDLSEFESGSVFFRDIHDCISNSRPVVVVNPTVELLSLVVDHIAEGRISRVELWADASGVEGLWECTQNFDALAISQASSNGMWVKLRLVTSATGDRPASDLTFGLGASMIGAEKSIVQKGPDPLHSTGEASDARAELVRVVAKLMKPIKPYLPQQLIHFMYKILGAL